MSATTKPKLIRDTVTITHRGRTLRYVIAGRQLPFRREARIETVQAQDGADGVWRDIPGWRDNGMAGVWRLQNIWAALDGLKTPQWDPDETLVSVERGVEV